MNFFKKLFGLEKKEAEPDSNQESEVTNTQEEVEEETTSTDSNDESSVDDNQTQS